MIAQFKCSVEPYTCMSCYTLVAYISSKHALSVYLFLAVLLPTHYSLFLTIAWLRKNKWLEFIHFEEGGFGGVFYL